MSTLLNLLPNPKILKIILIIILLLGIYFRSVNLDSKIFWVDEIATAIRVAGYTTDTIIKELNTLEIVTVEQLLKYQKIAPEKPLKDTINALVKSPEHAPLYFFLARLWGNLFGSSVTAIRSLSVVFSLLSLPAIYWLSLELFNNHNTAKIALSLLSVSPFYVAYAQEARPYSLWTMIILLSSAAFLKAIRLNKINHWCLYLLLQTASYYTSLLSILLAIGKSLYIIINERFQPQKILKNYLIASTLSLIAFSPWLWVMVSDVQQIQDNTTWMRTPLELPAKIGIWIASILIIFGNPPLPQSLNLINVLGLLVFILLLLAIRILPTNEKQKILTSWTLIITTSIVLTISIINNHNQNTNTLEDLILLLVCFTTALIVLSLVSYSFYHLCLYTPTRPKYYLFSLVFSVPFILIIIDLIKNGQSAATPRYLVPFQLGIILVISNLLSQKLSEKPPKIIWQLSLSFLIIFGLISCGINYNESPFYQKSRNINNLPIATIISQTENSLVLYEPKQTLDILSLSHKVNHKVLFKPLENLSNINLNLNKFNNIFIFNPSPEIIQQFEQQNFKPEQIYRGKTFVESEITLTLWKINKPNR